MEVVLDILKKSIIPAAITLGIALGVVILHRLAKLYSKTTHTVLTMGTCVKVVNDSELDIESGETREMSGVSKAIFKANVNGEEMEVKHNVGVNNMPIRIGDVVEILVDPKARTYIYSDNGYREYRRLRRERGYRKSWPIFLVFIFIFATAWLVVNCRQRDDSGEPVEVVCEKVDGDSNIHICHPKRD